MLGHEHLIKANQSSKIMRWFNKAIFLYLKYLYIDLDQVILQENKDIAVGKILNLLNQGLEETIEDREAIHQAKFYLQMVKYNHSNHTMEEINRNNQFAKSKQIFITLKHCDIPTFTCNFPIQLKVSYGKDNTLIHNDWFEYLQDDEKWLVNIALKLLWFNMRVETISLKFQISFDHQWNDVIPFIKKLMEFFGFSNKEMDTITFYDEHGLTLNKKISKSNITLPTTKKIFKMTIKDLPVKLNFIHELKFPFYFSEFYEKPDEFAVLENYIKKFDNYIFSCHHQVDLENTYFDLFSLIIQDVIKQKIVDENLFEKIAGKLVDNQSIDIDQELWHEHSSSNQIAKTFEFINKLTSASFKQKITFIQFKKYGGQKRFEAAIDELETIGENELDGSHYTTLSTYQDLLDDLKNKYYQGWFESLDWEMTNRPHDYLKNDLLAKTRKAILEVRLLAPSKKYPPYRYTSHWMQIIFANIKIA